MFQEHARTLVVTQDWMENLSLVSTGPGLHQNTAEGLGNCRSLLELVSTNCRRHTVKPAPRQCMGRLV